MQIQVLTDSALNLAGTSVQMKATLYRGTGGSGATATPLVCSAPTFTGVVPAGTVEVAHCTASVPFTAGEVGFVRFDLTAAGASPALTSSFTASVGLVATTHPTSTTP
jgi:hypothetical protein